MELVRNRTSVFVVSSRLRSVASSSAWLALSSLAAVTGFLFLSCLFFVPRWETNDDVAMSMVAHGYGIAAYGSPDLVFSGVLWGYVARAIPSVYGVLGYSIAALLALLAAGSAILYFLLRLRVGIYASTIAVFLFLLRPTLFPQFTLNAGLLTVAAVLGFWVYARSGKSAALVLASVLAFVGYLVRSQEFFVVFIVALPLVAYSGIRTDRKLQVAAGVLFSLFIVAALFDHSHYTGSKWERYNDLNAVRAAFTDFGAADRLRSHPEILARYGYSENDLNLIQHFFFVDPKIANPQTLKALLADLGPAGYLSSGISAGYSSVKAMISPEIFPVTFCALALLALRPRLPVFLSWAILCATVFVMGFAGRGGVLRTDIPALDLLCAISLIFAYLPSRDADGKGWLRNARARRLIAASVVTLSAILAYRAIAPNAFDSMRRVRMEQANIRGLPNEVVVDWGAGLAIEYIFPLLANDPQAHSMRLYPFGVFTFAPFSVASAEEASGRGFIERVRSPLGILMVADQNHLEELRIWCSERFGGQLRSAVLRPLPVTTVQRVWCESRVKPEVRTNS